MKAWRRVVGGRQAECLCFRRLRSQLRRRGISELVSIFARTVRLEHLLYTFRPPISKANKSACPAAGTIVVGWPTNARNRGDAYR